MAPHYLYVQFADKSFGRTLWPSLDDAVTHYKRYQHANARQSDDVTSCWITDENKAAILGRVSSGWSPDSPVRETERLRARAR